MLSHRFFTYFALQFSRLIASHFFIFLSVMIALQGCTSDTNHIDENYIPFTFGSNVRVNPEYPRQTIDQYPSLKCDDTGTIHIVWTEFSVYYAKSTDDGQHFTYPLLVSFQNNVWQAYPKLNIDSRSDLYVVWAGFNADPGGNVYISQRYDGGESFSPAVRINSTVSSEIQNNFPEFTLDSDGIIYVVWNQFSEETFEQRTYFSKSIDDGVSFFPERRIDSREINQAGAVLAVDEDTGIIYIVWNTLDYQSDDSTLYLTTSSDGGETFILKSVINDATNGRRGGADIHVDCGIINVVWSDGRNGTSGSKYDVYHSKSADGGKSFSINTKIDDIEPEVEAGCGGITLVVTDCRNICVAWSDTRNGSDDIFFSESIDGGESFKENIRVDDTGSEISQQWGASMDGNVNGDVVVSWGDARGQYEDYPHTDIYLSRGTKSDL